MILNLGLLMTSSPAASQQSLNFFNLARAAAMAQQMKAQQQQQQQQQQPQSMPQSIPGPPKPTPNQEMELRSVLEESERNFAAFR